MTKSRGGVVAAGILCAIAGTIALWCGPLALATSAMHTSGAQPAHAIAHVTGRAHSS
jgi:hypothetical protein